MTQFNWSFVARFPKIPLKSIFGLHVEDLNDGGILTMVQDQNGCSAAVVQRDFGRRQKVRYVEPPGCVSCLLVQAFVNGHSCSDRWSAGLNDCLSLRKETAFLSQEVKHDMFAQKRQVPRQRR